MIFRGTTVSLSNYKTIFSECSPDVLDEIRLAIMDDTDIIEYINPCGMDSYKLNQIRLALRENVEKKYILSQLTPKTINLLRECNRQRLDLSQLSRYVVGGRVLVSIEMFETMVYSVCCGADITQINFMKVHEDICEVLCQGLVRGYPMWLFTGDIMTEPYIRVLMRGLDLGIDISPCLNQIFSESQLLLIFSKAKYSSLLKKITPKFPFESIKVLLYALEDNLDITQLLYRDRDGYPIYSHLQMSALVKALELEREGQVYPDVFNPSLSDKEMYDMMGIVESDDFLLE